MSFLSTHAEIGVAVPAATAKTPCSWGNLVGGWSLGLERVCTAGVPPGSPHLSAFQYTSRGSLSHLHHGRVGFSVWSGWFQGPGVRSLQSHSMKESHCWVLPRSRARALTPAVRCLLSIAIWLILPVVICLSQRLSHACLSSHYFLTVKPRMAH